MENKNKRQEMRGLGKCNESGMEYKRISKTFKKGKETKIESKSLICGKQVIKRGRKQKGESEQVCTRKRNKQESGK